MFIFIFSSIMARLFPQFKTRACCKLCFLNLKTIQQLSTNLEDWDRPKMCDIHDILSPDFSPARLAEDLNPPMGLTVEARLIWAMGSCRWSSNGLLQVSFHVFGWYLNCRAKGGKNRVKTDPQIGNSEGSKIMPKPCIPHTPERHPCAATVALLNDHFTNQYKSYVVLILNSPIL